MNKVVSIVIGFLLFTSCSHKHATPTYSKNSSQNIRAKSSRAMVHKAEVELVVKNSDSLPHQVLTIVEKVGGHLLAQKMNSELWSEIKIAVPAEELKPILLKISLLGKCISSDVTSLDVTEDYENLEIRLESSKRARKRFSELLDLSPDVENILKIERELQRLSNEIENYESRLKRMDQEINYSEITVRYRKKQKPGVLGYVFVGLYRGVVWLFVRDY